MCIVLTTYQLNVNQCRCTQIVYEIVRLHVRINITITITITSQNGSKKDASMPGYNFAHVQSVGNANVRISGKVTTTRYGSI